MPQIQEALQNPDPSAALRLVSLEGGPSAVAPGLESQATMNLIPGQYLLLCFIAGSDGIPYLAKGMVKPFEVTGSAQPPQSIPAQVDVTGSDFKFEMPATVSAGETTFEFYNAGPQPHEMSLLEIPEGVDPQEFLEQFRAQFQGGPPEGEQGTPAGTPGAGEPPTEGPPLTAVGGINGLSSGKTGWATVDLEAGGYLVVCFIPDPATGAPHAALGMATVFTAE